MSTVPTCQHLKVNGIRCGCPALRNRRFCYFHDESRKRQRASAQRKRCIYPRNHVIEFPVLEDANAVQVALMQTLDGLLDGRLNERQTGLILYALQTASANLKHTTFKADEPGPEEPWVGELLTALRALPTSEPQPDSALVGAGAPPARASEARLIPNSPTTHVDRTDPARTDLQSSISKSSIVNSVIPKIHASTEPLQLPSAQAPSVSLWGCGDSVLPTFSGHSPICYNLEFPNLARRNSYGRRFDAPAAPGRPHRR